MLTSVTSSIIAAIRGATRALAGVAARNLWLVAAVAVGALILFG